MKTIIKSLVFSAPFIFFLVLNQTETLKEASKITGCLYAITFVVCRLILHPLLKIVIQNTHLTHFKIVNFY